MSEIGGVVPYAPGLGSFNTLPDVVTCRTIFFLQPEEVAVVMKVSKALNHLIGRKGEKKDYLRFMATLIGKRVPVKINLDRMPDTDGSVVQMIESYSVSQGILDSYSETAIRSIFLMIIGRRRPESEEVRKARIELVVEASKKPQGDGSSEDQDVTMEDPPKIKRRKSQTLQPLILRP